MYKKTFFIEQLLRWLLLYIDFFKIFENEWKTNFQISKFLKSLSKTQLKDKYSTINIT